MYQGNMYMFSIREITIKRIRYISAFLFLLCSGQTYTGNGWSKKVVSPLWQNTVRRTHAIRTGIARFYYTSNPENLLDQTNVPADIKLILDAHAHEVQNIFTCAARRKWKRICNEPWLPDYFIKHGVERYENAQRLGMFIQQRNLALMQVATKYLYHIPTRPYEVSNDNYWTIAKKVEGSHTRHIPHWNIPIHHEFPYLNDNQITQLRIIEKELPYKDLHGGNIIVTGKCITIIDTDRNAM